MFKYLNRHTNVPSIIKRKKSCLILGPRGTGKSVYIEKLTCKQKNLFSINLLKTDIFTRYLADPSLLRKEVEQILKKTETLIVIIDEVQKVPSILNEVHFLIEAYKNRCTFILTGSSARKLKQQNINLLAGRAILVPFFSFNYKEVDFKNNLNNILQFGLLPEVFLDDNVESKIDFLKTYTGVYLKEEIMQESLVRNIGNFNQFLELAAQLNGSQINYRNISKKIGVSDNTVKSHYEILEDTLIVSKIPAWTNSVKKQLQKAAKYYFFDNGVINSLTGELKTELKPSSFRYGLLFENLVVNEIIKINSLLGHDYKIFHYKSNHELEIDIILQKNLQSNPIAIEIKSSTSPTAQEVKNILSIRQDYPKARCIVICNTPNNYIENEIEFLSFPSGIKDIF
ncbi:MAG: ATP-binding protein [Bdellovibrionales bacterium]|nr:ATP-binding protein [Bdellovibrionales bacterium]